VLSAALRWLRASPLGSRDRQAQTDWQAVWWWESRRLVFNFVVGVAGVITSVIVLAIAVISERVLGVPYGMPDPPIVAVLGVVVFAAGANVCYTGGWIAELLVRRVWPDESDRFGTLMFTLGLPFAVVITLLPAALIGLAAVGAGFVRWLET
jgi:hypothetical protein